MKVLLDLNDDLAHRIATFAKKHNKSFEGSVHALLESALPAKVECPELTKKAHRDELSRIRYALHIDRMYEVVKRMEVGQEITFDNLLTDEQKRMTKPKKNAWRRSLLNFCIGRDDYDVVIIDKVVHSIKRLR